MARRPAHLGPSHPRGPHPTRRPLVARKSLPNLERPQHVRPHHAGLPHRHEPRRPTSWSLSGTAPPSECDVNSLPYLTTIQPHQPPPRHQDRLPRLTHSTRKQPLIHHAAPTTTPNKGHKRSG